MTEIKQDRFMFFANFAEAIQELPEEEHAEAYKAICEYGIYGILPKNKTLKGMCIMSMPSLFKKEKRGGNHNPTGKNQHSDGEVKEVKEVKTGQSGQNGQTGQSFLETETETETETENLCKKETEKEKPSVDNVDNFLKSASASLSESKNIKNKVLVSSEFSVSKVPELQCYVNEMPEDVILAVEQWIIKSKSGQNVDISFIIKQFFNFAKRMNRPIFKEQDKTTS